MIYPHAEENDLSVKFPEIVDKLNVYATIARNWIGDENRITRNSRPAGYVAFSKPFN